MIVSALPTGTVIKGGCHGVVVVVPTITVVWARPFIALQVAPPAAAAVPVPHIQPHMGTMLPSGRVVVCRVAVRVTDWAEDIPTVKRRIIAASTDFFRVASR